MMKWTLAIVACAFVFGMGATATAQPPERPDSDVLTTIWPGPSPQLGVEVISLTPELKAHFGARDDLGVLVGRVDAGSLASNAGILVGDVIVRLDGAGVSSARGLRELVYAMRAGQRITIDLMRAGRLRRLATTIPASTVRPPEGNRFGWPTDLLDPWQNVPTAPDPWEPRSKDRLEERVRELELRMREFERRYGGPK